MPRKPTCSRGDVVLVLFPHSDLRTAKPRPAVIVQANDLDTGMSQVIVAAAARRRGAVAVASRASNDVPEAPAPRPIMA
jgi:mRNA interferase MazF